MTKRETKIARAILAVLHELEGGQIHELPLHAEVNLICECTGSEFEAALRASDAHKWIIGIRSKFKGLLWNISDAGEAALIEML
jgi:hypothetical protein